MAPLFLPRCGSKTKENDVSSSRAEGHLRLSPNQGHHSGSNSFRLLPLLVRRQHCKSLFYIPSWEWNVFSRHANSIAKTLRRRNKYSWFLLFDSSRSADESTCLENGEGVRRWGVDGCLAMMSFKLLELILPGNWQHYILTHTWVWPELHWFQGIFENSVTRDPVCVYTAVYLNMPHSRGWILRDTQTQREGKREAERDRERARERDKEMGREN